MARIRGPTAVVSIADGGAPAARGGHELRSWSVLALLVGVAVACIAALALARLPASRARRGAGMARIRGPTAVVSIADGGPPAARGGHELRSWRVPALLVGAAVACIAALALGKLPAVPSTP